MIIFIGRDAKYQLKKGTPIFYLCLVGTNPWTGIPWDALSFFDVFSEMEFEGVPGITFLSVHDLRIYYEKQTGRNGRHKTVYELAVFFIRENPDALYFVDEVPFIKNG